MKIDWKPVLIAGIVSQLLLLLMMRFAVSLNDSSIFWLIFLLVHFIPLFLGGLWIALKIQSRFILHGVLVGVVANLLLVLLVPTLMLLSMHGPADATISQTTKILMIAVKIFGSAAGAYVGGILKSKMRQRVPVK